MLYFKKINSFLVWDASFLVTVDSRQCLDMTVGKIENGLERGFVKHRLNRVLKTDPCGLAVNCILFFYHLSLYYTTKVKRIRSARRFISVDIFERSKIPQKCIKKKNLVVLDKKKKN